MSLNLNCFIIDAKAQKNFYCRGFAAVYQTNADPSRSIAYSMSCAISRCNGITKIAADLLCSNSHEKIQLTVFFIRSRLCNGFECKITEHVIVK